MDMMYIEDCCEILDSMRVPITASDREEGEYPYYGANGIQDHVADYIFDDELVLLAEDGGNFGSKERPIAYRASGKCWVNNHAHVLKPKAGLDVDYLCYSLMFYKVDGMVNGATRQKLTQAAMRKMKIPSRSMKEQLHIVDELNRILKIKEQRQQELTLLDDLIKARFVELFGDPILNEKGWNTKPLLEMGNCKNGMNFRYDDCAVEINCLGVGDFKDLSVIENTDLLPTVSLNEMPSEEYLLKDDDIVFVRSNGNKALVGRSLAVYPGNVPTTFSGFCIRYRKHYDEITVPYLLRVLKTDSMRIKMAGRGANIQNLNQQILGTLIIPLPPIELQNKFADFAHQIDKSKVATEKALNETQKLFDRLIQEYVIWIGGGLMAIMTVYHGGYETVECPEIRVGRNTKDFGTGFYCTIIKEQAQRWARRYDTKIVSIYDVRIKTDLKIKEFKEMTEEWLDFIIACRSGEKHNYDIVIGAMADDQVYNYISDYMDGTITREQFWVLARFKYPTHQIVFCTEDALQCLEYRGFEEVV